MPKPTLRNRYYFFHSRGRSTFFVQFKRKVSTIARNYFPERYDCKAYVNLVCKLNEVECIKFQRTCKYQTGFDTHYKCKIESIHVYPFSHPMLHYILIEKGNIITIIALPSHVLLVTTHYWIGND